MKEAGQIAWYWLSRTQQSMFFNACKVGRSPVQLQQPLWIHVSPYCGFVILRPVDRAKPGAPVTAGRDSALARLVFLLCFIPPSLTDAEAENCFYLPGAAASHSLLPNLSQSTPPSLALLLLSASSLLLPLPASPSLFLSLHNPPLSFSFLCHIHTWPKTSPEWQAARGTLCLKPQLSVPSMRTAVDVCPPKQSNWAWKCYIGSVCVQSSRKAIQHFYDQQVSKAIYMNIWNIKKRNIKGT